MGRFAGFRCDLCTTVSEGSGREKNDTPFGWITVQVKTTEPGNAELSVRMLCSNDCLFKFASERRKADREEKALARQAAAGQKEALSARMNHVRFHENENVTDESCEYCQAATAPS